MVGDPVRTKVHDGAPAGLTLDNPPSDLVTREAMRAFLAKSRYSSGRAGEGDSGFRQVPPSYADLYLSAPELPDRRLSPRHLEYLQEPGGHPTDAIQTPAARAPAQREYVLVTESMQALLGTLDGRAAKPRTENCGELGQVNINVYYLSQNESAAVPSKASFPAKVTMFLKVEWHLLKGLVAPASKRYENLAAAQKPE